MYLLTFLCLWTSLASSQASLRPHRSCFRVSPCVLSSNLGAHGFRSRGSHFWMIRCDGPFLSRFSCATHRGFRQLDCVIRSQLSISHSIDFLWGRSSDTQPDPIIFQWSHRSFCATFLWLFTGLPAHQPRRVETYNCHHTCIRIQTLWLKHTEGCQKSHDGSVHVPQRKCLHCFLPFYPEGLSPLRLPCL